MTPRLVSPLSSGVKLKDRIVPHDTESGPPTVSPSMKTSVLLGLALAAVTLADSPNMGVAKGNVAPQNVDFTNDKSADIKLGNSQKKDGPKPVVKDSELKSKPILLAPPPPPPPGYNYYGPPVEYVEGVHGHRHPWAPLPPPTAPIKKETKVEAPVKKVNKGGNLFEAKPKVSSDAAAVKATPTIKVDLKSKVREKATETVNADIAVDKNISKKINVQEGQNAVGPAGKGPAASTFVAHTVQESGTTKVMMSQATGAAAANSRFFPGGVMPMGNVDMVFPDIVINNANDINNANENQNQVAAANENANLNPNNAANQNANQNFNEFTEVKEFKEFNEQQFAENHFNFEEKNFYLLNGPGPTATIVREIEVPVTKTVAVTEVVHGHTTVANRPVTETVVIEQIQTVRVPGETVIEQVAQKTVVEEVRVPGETLVQYKTIVEEVQIPGATIVEEIYDYKTVTLPAQTVVEQVQIPGATVVQYATVTLPVQTVVERLPAEKIIEQVYATATVTAQLPGQTVIEKEYVREAVPVYETIYQEKIVAGKPVEVPVTKIEQVIVTNVVEKTIANEVHVTKYATEQVEIPVTRTITETEKINGVNVEVPVTVVEYATKVEKVIETAAPVTRTVIETEKINGVNVEVPVTVVEYATKVEKVIETAAPVTVIENSIEEVEHFVTRTVIETMGGVEVPVTHVEWATELVEVPVTRVQEVAAVETVYEDRVIAGETVQVVTEKACAEQACAPVAEAPLMQHLNGTVYQPTPELYETLNTPVQAGNALQVNADGIAYQLTEEAYADAEASVDVFEGFEDFEDFEVVAPAEEAVEAVAVADVETVTPACPVQQRPNGEVYVPA
ncbi:Protein of unknown function, partial [Pyronema omphalodes CBS 100304]